jgi:glycopeptide antibiotics resistance protein
MGVHSTAPITAIGLGVAWAIIIVDGVRRRAAAPTVVARLMFAGAVALIVFYAVLPASLSLDDWRFNRVDPLSFRPLRTIRAYLNHGLIDVERRQLLGNIALFVPLGFTMPWTFARMRSAWRTTLVGALASLTVELTQAVLPEHGPDIDDVILNTIGAAVGYLAYAACFAAWRQARGSTRGAAR